MNNIKCISLLFVCISFAYVDSEHISQETFNRYKIFISTYMKDCKISKMDRCIIDGLERIRPQLIEPLNVDTLNFSIPEKNIKEVILDNVVARGWTKFKIDNVNLSINKKREHVVNFEVKFRQLDLTAEYKMQGALFGLRLNTFGDLNACYTNVKMVVDSIVSSTKKGGQRSLQLDDIKISFVVGDAHTKLVQADNSFLGREIADFASSKPTATLSMMLPILEEKVTSLIKEHVINSPQDQTTF